MKNVLFKIMFGYLILVCLTIQGVAANKETIETAEAYIGENSVRVNIFCHNEDGLLEYFNLIIFDDSKLDFVSIEADRGTLSYGYYPTHVVGDHIYVHGVASPPGYCIAPDCSEPGSPLFHITFNVKSSAGAGLAELNFASEGVWNGHWNDCSGYQISPNPEYYNGGVNILGHAGHITIECDSASAGEQVIVDIYLHNDLDVFEYFNQILFEQGVAVVDSIVPARGTLHYGYYPTHVSGDTIFVHGWADKEDCFYADHSYPGAPLYRIYFTLHEWAPPGHTMPLTYLGASSIWNHWVGCDLYTTDSFTATNGSVRVLQITGVEDRDPTLTGIRLERATPNPTSFGTLISYFLGKEEHVTVAIFNAAGKRIRTLASGPRNAGRHHVNWDGKNEGGRTVASGVYFCLLEAGSRTSSKKLLIIR